MRKIILTGFCDFDLKNNPNLVNARTHDLLFLNEHFSSDFLSSNFFLTLVLDNELGLIKNETEDKQNTYDVVYHVAENSYVKVATIFSNSCYNEIVKEDCFASYFDLDCFNHFGKIYKKQ